MAKIVINACYGGFGLSDKAIRRYAEIKGLNLYVEKDELKFLNIYWTVPPEERVGYLKHEDWMKASVEDRQKSNDFYGEHTIYSSEIDRKDPALIQVVEELGEEANGQCAELTVVELAPGTLYRITEYDGYEGIETNHDDYWDVA